MPAIVRVPPSSQLALGTTRISEAPKVRSRTIRGTCRSASARTVSGASGPAVLTDHNYAIQAQALKSLKLGTAAIVKDFAAALFFDPAASEDMADAVVRVLT